MAFPISAARSLSSAAIIIGTLFQENALLQLGPSSLEKEANLLFFVALLLIVQKQKPRRNSTRLEVNGTIL